MALGAGRVLLIVGERDDDADSPPVPVVERRHREESRRKGVEAPRRLSNTAYGRLTLLDS